MTPYYDDGSIRIYHGDSLEVMDALAPGAVDIVITDPPYVIGAVSAGTLGSKAGGWQDMMNSSPWFASWYRQTARLLKHNGAMWSFCNWRSLPVRSVCWPASGTGSVSSLTRMSSCEKPTSGLSARPRYVTSRSTATTRRASHKPSWRYVGT